MDTNTTPQQTSNCLRCGRALRATKSVTSGYGPTCARRVRDAARTEAVATYKPAQIAKATELIEQGGIVAIRGRRVFRSVSSDGTRSYLTASTGQCNCPAGLKSVRCYHTAAARLLLAA